MRLRARARHPRSARRPPDSAPRRRARNETRLRVAAPSGPVNRRLLGEAHLNVPFGRPAVVIDDSNQVHARGSRTPGQCALDLGAHRSRRCRRTRTHSGHRPLRLLQGQSLPEAPNGAARSSRCVVASRCEAAWDLRSRTAATAAACGGHAGLTEQFQHVRRPEFEHLEACARGYGGQPGRAVC